MELNKNIDVSIIILNYNSCKLLENCLESVIGFTQNINYEIIVVDNNSYSCNIKNILERKFPQIKLITNTSNVGFAAANNQGLKVSQGKYVLFLNNDTIFLENTIKKIFDYAEALDSNAIIGCKLLNPDLSWQVSFAEFPNIKNIFTSNFFLYLLFPRSKKFNKYYLKYYEILNPIEVDYVSGAFLFCKTSIAKELNGFDPRFYFYSEEIDFCYRCKEKFAKVIFNPLTSVIHIGGATANKNLWFYYKNKTISLIQFYQKYYNGVRYGSFIFAHYLGLVLRSFFYLISGVIILNKIMLKKAFIHIKLFFIYPANKFLNVNDEFEN